jgi:hypothetical protein
MSKVDTGLGDVIFRQEHSGWRELWLKEDWWAIWLGLVIVAIAYLLFTNGSSLRWLAVTPDRTGFRDITSTCTIRTVLVGDQEATCRTAGLRARIGR